MKVFDARYYDGKTSTCHHVSVVLTGLKLRLVGTDVSEEFDARGVRRSLRIADTPRWLYLPGGGVCVTEENDTVDAMVRERRYDRLLHQWESRPAYAVVAVALVAVAAWLLIDFALPVAADQVATRIPVEAEETIGREAMRGLDEYLMRPSELPPRRQAQLREKHFVMMRAAGDRTPYKLEFRASRIGPNAFALPSGIIVMTDELVKLAGRDEEILAVLAHEVGHLHHRHTMRRLLEGSATALVIAGITGDIGSAAAFASAVPTLLLQTKYSRENEREADGYAADLLRKAKISPRYLGVMLERMEDEHKGGRGIPTFLSSHPATDERVKFASTDPPVEAAAQKEEEEKPVAKVRPKVVNTVRSSLLTLLDKRDYESLERTLGELQAGFEQGSSPSERLTDSFRAFRSATDDIALNEWVEKYPKSYAARTARGEFYLWRGVTARNAPRDRNEPAWKSAQTHADLLTAREDFHLALEMTAKPIATRMSMIMLMRYLEEKEEGRDHYLAAAKLAPHSTEVRIARMISLEPRWGGSYEQMEAFVGEVRRDLKDPADVGRIAARISFLKAVDQDKAGKYEDALRLYNQGLQQSKEPYMLCSRSWVQAKLKRHEEAYRDAKEGLAMQHDEPYCLERAADEIHHLKDHNERIRMATHIIERKPELPSAYNQRGFAYTAIGKPELAFPDLLASAKLGDAWGQATVGHAYLNGIGVKKDPAAAMPWLIKAAAQGEPEAIKLLERVDQQKTAKKGG